VKLIYFGSPDISAQLLERLCQEAGHEVAAVVTNPDRPKGRSKSLQPTAVAAFAESLQLPVFKFDSLKGDEGRLAQKQLSAFDADLMIVFAYGSIIPKDIFELPRLGSVNLHGSLLPLLRGASPVHTAILQGFQKTGWTLQKLGERMDAGDILSSVAIDIEPDETTGDLFGRMMPLGIDLVIQSLPAIDQLIGRAIPQAEEKATYCQKIKPADTLVDWTLPNQTIHNQIRALSPDYLARSKIEDDKFVLFHRSRMISNAEADQLLVAGNDSLSAGTVLIVKASGKKRLLVATGSGFLEIVELQIQGRNRLDAHSFLNGNRIKDQMQF